MELLIAPHRKRGQQYLPSVVDRPQLAEPHRMPLNDRTRDLLSRKLERSRFPRPELDHPIDLKPPVGARAEPGETLSVGDGEKRSGHAAIRRSGDPLSRKLRRRLASTAAPKDEPAPSGTEPIQAGDSVARRARLKRKRNS